MSKALNKWVAECIPCKWETHHDEEDRAIEAAEDHVAAYHRHSNGFARAQERIGHVQLRTVILGEWRVAERPNPDPIPAVTPPHVSAAQVSPTQDAAATISQLSSVFQRAAKQE